MRAIGRLQAGRWPLVLVAGGVCKPPGRSSSRSVPGVWLFILQHAAPAHSKQRLVAGLATMCEDRILATPGCHKAQFVVRPATSTSDQRPAEFQALGLSAFPPTDFVRAPSLNAT